MKKLLITGCNLVSLGCLVSGLLILFGIAGAVDNGAEYATYGKELITAIVLMVLAVIGSNLSSERN